MPAAKKKASATKIEVKGPKGLTPKQIALDLGITARQLRYFLREHGLRVGRGKRYDFTAAEAKKIKAIYAKEHDSQTA